MQIIKGGFKMEDFKTKVYGIFTGLQACSFCIETEASYYLEAIGEYLEKNERNYIHFSFLEYIERHCPGFCEYLKNENLV